MHFEKRNGSTSSSNYMSITLRKTLKICLCNGEYTKLKLPTDQRTLTLSRVQYDISYGYVLQDIEL